MSVKISRAGGMSASVERVGGMSVSATRQPGITARMALVCGASLNGDYELLWVQDDAMLATVRGDYLVVKKSV